MNSAYYSENKIGNTLFIPNILSGIEYSNWALTGTLINVSRYVTGQRNK